jgi:ABC-2 type transport system ATP-binding protein
MTSVISMPSPGNAARDERASKQSVIATRGLTKKYGDRYAVRDLTIAIPTGVIAGFVGPNGAGKTTTIRMLLGLVRPSGGSAEVLGTSIGHATSYLPRVGALIESPAFYPALSGRANLQVLCSLGGFSKDRIPRLIETVGLTGRDREKVRGYSLGMKQRLGVAAALLPDPDLLILDEPSNGLDPPGIIEMRDLLRSLRDQGKTVFVSSHLLGEIQQVADWLVVLKEGESIFSGTTANIFAARGSSFFVVPERPDQREAVARIVQSSGHTVAPKDDGLMVGAPQEFRAELSRLCVKAGITLIEIRPTTESLEETFLAMIEGDK